MRFVVGKVNPYVPGLAIPSVPVKSHERYGSPKYVDLLVDILDTSTGVEWLKRPCQWPWCRGDSWDDFLYYFVFEWGENNWSCDHHRGPLTGDDCPRPLPDSLKGEHSDWEEGGWFCGHDLKVRVWHNGEVIFSDYPDGAQ